MIKIAVCDDIDYIRDEIKKKLLDFSFRKTRIFPWMNMDQGNRCLHPGSSMT